MDGIFLFILLLAALIALDVGANHVGVDPRDGSADSTTPAPDPST